ncbi:MAG: DNA helicase RecQ [Methanosarcinaceae archaeon]|nr:DNA helicase RecQ [Methanosarcinaceae archaeon]
MYLALQQYFGYTSFRPLQENIINDVLDRKDAFVLMPTGGGKSLCYQLPALLQEGVTVVVSPLISLMKDQVDGLEANGVAAACMNSSQSPREIRDVKDAFLENRIKVLYVAPERLMMPSTLSLLKRGKVSLFAIDEAHCISEWGHDFRPEYRKLKLLRDSSRGFSDVPVIALTATATERVKKDIISQLKLSIDPEKGPYVASFNRQNLYYEIRAKKETFSEIRDYLRRHRGDAGIIYCQSRNNVESLASKLTRAGFRALPYHAGLADAERAENQERFLKDDVDIIVATIAFGMGIDKSNVRFVIHYDLPRNLESYYQETGRGGRDGGPCECILFFSRGDRFRIEYFIQQKSHEKEKDLALVQLRQMVAYCESRRCRRAVLLEYFGDSFSGNCGNCDTCLRPKATFDGTEAAKKLIVCVQELNQRFGTNYVIDILAGSKNKKIKANRHERLKSHGSGREFTKEQWKALASEMANSGILDVQGARYPLLKLNARSREVLRGKERVELACPPGYMSGEGMEDAGNPVNLNDSGDLSGPVNFNDSGDLGDSVNFSDPIKPEELDNFENFWGDETGNSGPDFSEVPDFSARAPPLSAESTESTFRARSRLSKISKDSAFSSSLKPAVRTPPRQVKAGPDPILFERLRALRKQIAVKKNLPPYIIFSDTSLREMAEKLPESKEEFHAITGVGDHKLRKYGDDFLREIVNYRRDYGLEAETPEIDNGGADETVSKVPFSENAGAEGTERSGSLPNISRRYLDTSIQDWSVGPAPDRSPSPELSPAEGESGADPEIMVSSSPEARTEKVKAYREQRGRSFGSENSLEKTLSLSKQRLGIYEIADLNGLNPKAVCKQLEKLILSGKVENIDGLVSPGKQQRIKKAIEEVETELYSRLLEKMKGGCSEEEIRLVRALLFMQS